MTFWSFNEDTLRGGRDTRFKLDRSGGDIHTLTSAPEKKQVYVQSKC